MIVGKDFRPGHQPKPFEDRYDWAENELRLCQDRV